MPEETSKKIEQDAAPEIQCAPEVSRFPISKRMEQDINNRFTYHAPTGSQPGRYVDIREKARELAYLIVQCSNESREQSLALTKLQEAVMWANAGIACNG